MVILQLTELLSLSRRRISRVGSGRLGRISRVCRVGGVGGVGGVSWVGGVSSGRLSGVSSGRLSGRLSGVSRISRVGRIGGVHWVGRVDDWWLNIRIVGIVRVVGVIVVHRIVWVYWVVWIVRINRLIRIVRVDRLIRIVRVDRLVGVVSVDRLVGVVGVDWGGRLVGVVGVDWLVGVVGVDWGCRLVGIVYCCHRRYGKTIGRRSLKNTGVDDLVLTIVVLVLLKESLGDGGSFKESRGLRRRVFVTPGVLGCLIRVVGGEADSVADDVLEGGRRLASPAISVFSGAVEDFLFCEVDCVSVQHFLVRFEGCGGGKSVARIASTLVLDGSDETFCLPVNNSGQVGQSVLKSTTSCGSEV